MVCPSHVCQMKRYVFTCFNFLGNCCSTWVERERDTKAQIQVPAPLSDCVWEPCLLWRRGPLLLPSPTLSLSFLVCFAFKWNVKPFDSGVVSYLIYFICGIYSSVLPRLLIQFLAFLFSCFCCGCCCCWCLSILMSFNWHGSGSTVSVSDLLSIRALYTSLASSSLSFFYCYFFMWRRN